MAKWEKHLLSDLISEVNLIAMNSAARKIEALAVQALLYEVAATPKPGLVDSANTGAHRDMNLFTFIRSACALGPAFSACYEAGAAHRGPAEALLPAIRAIGIAAEQAMLGATGGVNTHKGILFSMGMLCGAAGLLSQSREQSPYCPEALCDTAAAMVAGIIERDFGSLSEKPQLTYGERLYLQYGITGIRGEVAGGFQTVRRVALPLIRRHWGRAETNVLLVELLLQLMAHSEDSNILGRHDPAMLTTVRGKADAILKIGGAFTPEGWQAVGELDRWCIDHWVSPGGSADLLAVTVFLQLMEEEGRCRDVKC